MELDIPRVEKWDQVWGLTDLNPNFSLRLFKIASISS